LDSALAEVLVSGSEGSTNFYSAMRRSTRSLLGWSKFYRPRVVLLISDSPRPISLDIDGETEKTDPRLQRAALSARQNGVVFHTFGMSKEAADWRQKLIGQIAGATGGAYHPVEDPNALYCHLAAALRTSTGGPSWESAFMAFRRGAEK
jgi:Mg-chelatase subunit ChlD